MTPWRPPRRHRVETVVVRRRAAAAPPPDDRKCHPAIHLLAGEFSLRSSPWRCRAQLQGRGWCATAGTGVGCRQPRSYHRSDPCGAGLVGRVGPAGAELSDHSVRWRGRMRWRCRPAWWGWSGLAGQYGRSPGWWGASGDGAPLGPPDLAALGGPRRRRGWQGPAGSRLGSRCRRGGTPAVGPAPRAVERHPRWG
jgi:hypothetical protein